MPVEDESGHGQNSQYTEPLGGLPRKRLEGHRFLGHREIWIEIRVFQGLLRGEDGELQSVDKKVGERQAGVHEEV